MGALIRVLLAIAVLTPTAIAQPAPDPSALGGPVNDALREATPVAEDRTGENLTGEEIDLTLELDVTNAEFDLVGVLFGGGKVQTDLDATGTLAFRAVNVSRAETAMEAHTGRANVSLNETFGIDTNRSVVTAEEIRTAGGGLLLEAFQSYQQDATTRYLESTIPQVTVLSASFAWSNTEPARDAERAEDADDPEEGREAAEDTSLREPPLVLDASFTVRFLDRYALGDLVTQPEDDEEQQARALALAEEEDDALQERIEENQTAPFLEQSAFQVLGVGQLLQLELPPGWRLNVTMTVPEGYTIAGASDALVVDEDRQTASYYLDGSQQSDARTTSGVVTLSDRGLVTWTLLVGVGLVGVVLRIPVELAVFALRRRIGP